MFGCWLPRRRALLLTEEEALALLEMCAFTLAGEREVHASAVARIGDFCRGFRANEARGEILAQVGGAAATRGAARQDPCPA